MFAGMTSRFGDGRLLDGLVRVFDGAEQQVVDVGHVVGRHAESGGQGALRVEVDREHRRPYSASVAPRLMVVVVLPTPPFWLQRAMMRAGPCPFNGFGSGKMRRTRPVGPTIGASKPGSSAVKVFFLAAICDNPLPWAHRCAGDSILTGAVPRVPEARGTLRTAPAKFSEPADAPSCTCPAACRR